MPRSSSNPEVEFLLALVDQGFDTKSWHGPNLRSSFRGVTAEMAAYRPAAGRHNVWEVALHAAYWKYTVRRRLLNEKRGSFPLKGSNWFARPIELTASAWQADLKLLDEVHRSLREAVACLTDAQAGRNLPGSKLTCRFLIQGIAAHDVYHAGQVQLLRRMAEQAGVG
jgi:hypothetical protein